MAFNWVLILRAQQLVFSLIVLGLSAYGASFIGRYKKKQQNGRKYRQGYEKQGEE